MPLNTQYRSEAPEIMDDFGLRGAELEDALSGIARINQVLGGNSLTIDAIKRIVDKKKLKHLNILDLGCGNGDMLRALSQWAADKGYRFSMTGIDANPFTIGAAQRLSEAYPDITYRCADFMEHEPEQEPYDVVLLTLTLHHFSNAQIIRLLRQYRAQTRLAIIVNDLHRSRLAYFLFHLVSRIFRLNRINDSDGKLSILRGFKRKELQSLSKTLNLKQYTIRWKWAFRYQWIITDL